MYGSFNVRLLCATAAFQVPLLAVQGDASVPVSCWEENATMLSRGRRSQEEVRFPRSAFHHDLTALRSHLFPTEITIFGHFSLLSCSLVGLLPPPSLQDKPI